jgi:hypothetical protein
MILEDIAAWRQSGKWFLKTSQRGDSPKNDF